MGPLSTESWGGSKMGWIPGIKWVVEVPAHVWWQIEFAGTAARKRRGWAWEVTCHWERAQSAVGENPGHVDITSMSLLNVI